MKVIEGTLETLEEYLIHLIQAKHRGKTLRSFFCDKCGKQAAYELDEAPMVMCPCGTLACLGRPEYRCLPCVACGIIFATDYCVRLRLVRCPCGEVRCINERPKAVNK